MMGLLSYASYASSLTLLLFFFYVIYAGIGIQLFAGVTTRECPETSIRLATILHRERHQIANSTGSPLSGLVLDQQAMANITASGIEGLQFGECPPTLSCKSAGCFVVPNEAADDRTGEVYYFGFDNIWMAMLPQIVVTSLDEWPALAHPLTNSGSAYAFLGWPFYASTSLPAISDPGALLRV